MPIVIRRNPIIAHHLVWHGYGGWLANDPRGSGSTEVRNPELRELGPAHFGRKAIQPSREELRAFHRAAAPKLAHPVAWFDADARAVIAAATDSVIRARGYTCYAYCSCANHGHGMVRIHRDSGETMWRLIADATRAALHTAGLFPPDHPVWSDRPYVVYKTTVPAVYAGVEYIELNPTKEGLPKQSYPWVTKYDGWPLRRK